MTIAEPVPIGIVTTPQIPARPNAVRARRKRLALQVVSLVGLAYAASVWFRQLDLHQLAHTFAVARLWPLLLVALGGFGGIAWKAGFWRFALSALKPVPFRALLRYGVAAAVGSLLAPGRAGDAFRVWILRHRHGVPLSATLTVVGFEKLGDVAALVLLVAPLPWLAPRLPPAIRPWLLLLSGLPVLATLAVAAIRKHPRWSQFPAFVGLRMFDRAAPVALALACVFMAWSIDLACIELVLFAVGAKVTLAAGLLVLLLTNVAIAVPVVPGNFGAHELASALALKMVGVEVELATAFALLYHGLHTVPVLLAGFVDARRLLVVLAEEPAAVIGVI